MTKTDRRFIEIQGSDNIDGGYSKIDDWLNAEMKSTSPAARTFGTFL